jgi:serine/threonine protein kinase
VLPYVAPEVLKGNHYTQSSDVYSFGMIMYEYLAGLSPYAFYNKREKCYQETPHDTYLAIKICQGLRPQHIARIPPLFEDLVKKCWDSNPEARPSSEELSETLTNWLSEFMNKKDSEIAKQIQESEEYNQTLPKNIRFPKYKSHPQAIYTSRLLDFKNLPEPQNSKEINEQFWNSKSMKFDVSELHKAIEEINNQEDNLTNINPNLTPSLIHSWQSHNFTCHQTQDWLSIGLKPSDYQFASWLRDTKHLTPEEVLNHYNLEELNQEFFAWWQDQQQAQIEVVPK